MTMTATTQLKLSQTPKGRTLLHLICIKRDHKFIFHVKGIMREIKR